ncbi:hypothetical protein Pelo_7389 [Pelomyxa schiedti]|nr:hypothetical protein Pelo_7389 [Pelomyxa schiedti]
MASSIETMCMTIPDDVGKLLVCEKVQLHQVTWDPKLAASGLDFDRQNTVVEHTSPELIYRTALANEGWNSGCHFWSLQILNSGKNNCIMVGVCDEDSVERRTFLDNYFPGMTGEGLSYYGNNGHIYMPSAKHLMHGRGMKTMVYGNCNFGPAFRSGAEVGVLLNLNPSQESCTFYLNGTKVGAVGSEGLPAARLCKYFPSLATFEPGQRVFSLPPDEP